MWKENLLKEQLLTVGAFWGIILKGACFCSTKYVANTLTFSQTNIWRLLHLAEEISVSPLPPLLLSPTANPPSPYLNILHLFNYLVATLWFGPELQWKLYLQIREGLVTGAGQISLSRCCLREGDAFGHITQEEMPLPHCRFVISSLWSPRGQWGFVCMWRCVSM